MNKYFYRAKNYNGKDIKGWVEAPTLKSAVNSLRERQMVVISLSEAGKNPFQLLLENMQRISSNDVVNFTRQLSTMIDAGLPLVDSLKSLQEQSRPAIGKVLMEIVNDVRSGMALNEALEKHPKIFSKAYVAIVRSGEAAGLLDKILLKLAKNLEKKRRFTNKVKGAMIYPIIVTVAMVVVGFLMMTMVVPKLLGIYKEMGATLPLPTQILILISNFFVKFWWLLLIFTFGGIYTFLVWKNTYKGRHQWDYFLLKIPIIGLLNEKIILADLTRTLSLLVGTGVSIIEALDIVSKSSKNIIIEEAVSDSGREVEKGLPLASCLAKYEFFPPIVVQMVAVGEETGKLDEVLEKVSQHFEEESDMALKALISAIEPAMIVILGIGVAFLVVSVILPIYNLTSKF